MVNPPGLLPDNWIVFTGSGGIAIFASSLGAMAIIKENEPGYLDELLFFGLFLFILVVVFWAIYKLLRRLGWIGPAPMDIQQVTNDVDDIQDRLDRIESLDDRVSELEREVREKKLNDVDTVILGHENDVSIQ